jgi:hypothetical protein
MQKPFAHSALQDNEGDASSLLRKLFQLISLVVVITAAVVSLLLIGVGYDGSRPNATIAASRQTAGPVPPPAALRATSSSSELASGMPLP